MINFEINFYSSILIIASFFHPYPTLLVKRCAGYKIAFFQPDCLNKSLE